jgi:hypothetical protein
VDNVNAIASKLAREVTSKAFRLLVDSKEPGFSTLLLLNNIDMQSCEINVTGLSEGTLSPLPAWSQGVKYVSLAKYMMTECLLSRTLSPLPAWRATFASSVFRLHAVLVRRS